MDDSGEPRLYFTLEDEKDNYGNRLQLFNAIAEQIWREQQLVSNRMQWNFTFQAFLAAIFVFAVSDIDGHTQAAVPIVLSIVGLLVSAFCLAGVSAAQEQSTRLKRHWANEFHRSPPIEVGDCDIERGAFPQPFSKSKGSARGRLASRGVCWALIGMWAVMLTVIIAGLVFDAPAAADAFSCQITQAGSSGELAITCRAR